MYSAIATRNQQNFAAAQAAYDAALPDDHDEPDEPNFDPLVRELLDGHDSELLSFEGWAAAGGDELACDLLARLDDPAIFLRLVIKCNNSKDSALGDLVEPIMAALKEHAGQALEATYQKSQRR